MVRKYIKKGVSVQNCNTIIIVLQICNNINTFFEYYPYLPVFIFEAGRVCLPCEWNHRLEAAMHATQGTRE